MRLNMTNHCLLYIRITGTIHPRGTMILSSNKSFVESGRSVTMHTSTCKHILRLSSNMSLYRNVSRIVHISFFILESEESELQRNDAEKEMKAAYINASSSLSELIAIGNVN